ncbi:hypothetical protein ACB098_07G080800 [Castanea mollissima]
MAPPASSVQEATIHSNYGEKYADVNWDELGFSLTPTDFMFEMKCFQGEDFSQGNLIPYGKIELSPAAAILNYGQGLFEGLKAYRREDGHIVLFRPEQNAMRMKMGAERMCMPSPSVEQFIDAVKQTVLANKRWVPPPGKGSLYIRPLLMGSGSILGVAPAPEYTFLVYTSPVGNYYKGTGTPINLIVEDKLHRAIPRGAGGVKTIANYSPVLQALTQAKSKGFSDVLFLDAKTGQNIEEVSACNIFIVKVEERVIPVEELMDAEEVFCTGTAVVVNPVGSVTYQGIRVEYKTGVEAVSQKLCAMLTGIQTGRIKDKMGWTVEID